MSVFCMVAELDISDCLALIQSETSLIQYVCSCTKLHSCCSHTCICMLHNNDKLNNHVTASKACGSEAALLVTQIVGDNGVFMARAELPQL